MKTKLWVPCFLFFISNYSHKNKNKGQILKCNKKKSENMEDQIEILDFSFLQK
jgi:hypothetical protein